MDTFPVGVLHSLVRTDGQTHAGDRFKIAWDSNDYTGESSREKLKYAPKIEKVALGPSWSSHHETRPEGPGPCAQDHGGRRLAGLGCDSGPRPHTLGAEAEGGSSPRQDCQLGGPRWNEDPKLCASKAHNAHVTHRSPFAHREQTFLWRLFAKDTKYLNVFSAVYICVNTPLAYAASIKLKTQ